ncbi:nitronate monooxygenase [Saccharopolyspora sp.]|uniref:nitronate monooxygenase n=1 Tax=Saccharopolyspora sp. TaxID=33915 RepID=UPI00345D0B03
MILGPMAGGAGTPALAAAVSNAGGLGFLAAGYKNAAKLGEQIDQLRQLTSADFGVNLFVPEIDEPDPAGVRAYRERISTTAHELGAEPGDPLWTDDDWEAKVALLLADPVPVVSFTFGCPPADVVSSLHDVGSAVVGTVTGVAEAEQAQAAGVDALCVQGSEAGGHQASFNDAEERTTPLVDLLTAVRGRSSLPLIGAGGVMNAEHVRAVLDAGAVAAQLGTAFLRAAESGANPGHKDALVDPRYSETAVTRAFSGRRARGLVNSFMREHDAQAPVNYPRVHYLTAPLRAAAGKAGDIDRLNLWAGTRHELAEARPAGEIVAAVADRLATRSDRGQ